MDGKMGRNAPCPCGSGKKYKHCCLREDQKEQTRTRLQLKDRRAAAEVRWQDCINFVRQYPTPAHIWALRWPLPAERASV